MKHFYANGSAMAFLVRSDSAPDNTKFSATAVARMFAYGLLLTLYSLFTFSLSAQEPRRDSGADGLSAIGALAPGDTIPDAVWNMPLELHYFDGKKKNIHFRDLKGKVILLDFWATWCPSCIEGFPHLEDIKNKKTDSIEVLLINSRQNKDTDIRITKMAKTYKDRYGYLSTLPYIVGDEVFEKLFPHNTIPHLSWISRDGIFLANTYPDALTAEIIDAVVRDIAVSFHQKKIWKETDEQVLFNGDQSTTVFKGSAFGRYAEGLKPVYGKLSHNDGQSLYQIINLDFSAMLSIAFAAELKDLGWRSWIFESEKDPDWKRNALSINDYRSKFCYELVIPDSISPKRAKSIFRENLKQFFLFEVVRKYDERSVWEFSPIPERFGKLETKGGIPSVFIQGNTGEMQLRNVPLRMLLDNVSLYFDRPIVIDGYEELRIDISIPRIFADMDEDHKVAFLSQYGINLTAHTKRLEYVLFTQANARL